MALLKVEPAFDGLRSDPRWSSASGFHDILCVSGRWTVAAEVGSGLIGIRWMNHEVERPAVPESNGSEVTHVARCQPTDAERLGQRHDRSVNEAHAKIREASVHLHRT